MSQHARHSMPADREIEIAVDDFTLRGLLAWDPTAHDYEVVEVYIHQQGKAMLVDNADRLGALVNGEWKSFAHLLRWEASDA